MTIADDVRRGLSDSPKKLLPYLFYDTEGSTLYERITELPEYYPTRTERAILRACADEVVAAVDAGGGEAPQVVELGAGSASKTTWVLRAVLKRYGRCEFLPLDVSATALEFARSILEQEVPGVVVHPVLGRHEDAMAEVMREHPDHQRLVLFIGSSIGNFDDPAAVRLLTHARACLGPGGALLLGTDLRKDVGRMVAAYDDAQGVTAAFNKNVLARINRELGGHFDLDRFRHVALWNESRSRIEMHLESLVAQSVAIDALEMTVDFAAGERIHTESSVKYDLPRVDALFEAAGLARAKTFTDPEGLFGVHLARASR